MKNKKILMSLSVFALITMVTSPLLASANQDGKIGIELNARANVQADHENKKRDNKDDKYYKNFFFNFGRHGTTTVDVAPTIRDVRDTRATSTVSISWTTSEPASSEIRYATNSSVTASSSRVVDGALLTSHTMTLTGLAPHTTYYYVVVAKDASGNEKNTKVFHFKTKPLSPSDTVSPNILFSTTYGVDGNSAHIIWVTNELSDSSVWLGTNSAVNVSTTPTEKSTALTYFHNVVVSGLSTSTAYFYVVSSTDAVGNSSANVTGSFTTSTR